MKLIIRNFILLIFFVFTNARSITLEQAVVKISKEFNCNQKEIINAFDAIKIYFKSSTTLNNFNQDNFNYIKFNQSDSFANEIIKLIDNVRKNKVGNFTKVSIDDLKEHTKLRLVYNKYLKNSLNALFYYNPFLDETLILSVSEQFIVFTYLKFRSYYRDIEYSNYTKEIDVQYFVYDRANKKVLIY